ncbi:DUF4118 domain-containing protein [Ktedonobacter robiniae]|uniref:Sensor protein KdpD transmembrane domain-containing protein n=1 Tax=Ktedonobacter robiniae TaxID=2778365 RepID=A0ABQ3UGX3_9CHLR|nr:DUF4118 domain-containing protein [Ktedonobacter robiniae]GHO51958.1 hypothetical protein KSB_04330 [Ktedonobacter robiniae]
MRTIQQIPQVPVQLKRNWRGYLTDSVLAIAGALLCTALIYVFHLYPTIPNISVIYLLLILALASTRGRYAALLAALVAVFSFDFWLVPPLYTLTISRWEEVLALVVFLVAALLTGQLAGVMRRSIQEAWRREREARILYEVGRVINSTEQLPEQLQSIALSMVRVFAPWGVQACALLLPDKQGNLVRQAEAPISIEDFILSPSEFASASKLTGQTSLEKPLPSIAHPEEDGQILRLIPLRTPSQVLGVLCLRLKHPIPWLADDQLFHEEERRHTERATFFWTFLDQAILVIERAHFRMQALSANGQ